VGQGTFVYHAKVSETPLDANRQLGLLDLSVDLSVPEVYSGTEFTLYLHVKNPFSRAVWIKSVELSLPAQLTVPEPKEKVRKSPEDQSLVQDATRTLILERESEINRLRDLIGVGDVDDDRREDVGNKLRELEERTRADLASLSGGLILEPSGESRVHLNNSGAGTVIVRPSGVSRVTIDNRLGANEDERVRLMSSLPYGAALQPGSTDVWTIRLGSRRTPFFVPAKFKLQLTVIYALEKQPLYEQAQDDRDLYSNTVSFATQVRVALWSVILGGVVGAIVGSVARSLQGAGGAVAFSGPHANSTVGALLLAAILSGAAVVFSARKSDTQSFVTVEDFWGGLLVGFLIGYSGTAAFSRITNTQA
jgi:hypothetical protein